jgi:hypothetical protein
MSLAFTSPHNLKEHPHRINRDSPDDSQTNANIRAFSGLAARLTRGVDGYQQLGQPERWSSS